MSAFDYWHTIWILVHVLLFVYWLGGDLGVFYGSRFRNSNAQDVPTRQLIGKITGAVDMAPRTTLVLMMPVGLTLAADLDLSPVTGWWLGLVWIASLAWLWLVWRVHLEASPERKKRLAGFDMRLRWLVLVVLTVSALSTFISGEPFGENWLAVKVLLYAAMIGCGIMIRITIKPYGAAFQSLVDNGSTPETEATIQAVAKVSRRWVKTIWALLLVAAWFGIAQPNI
jgi:hypothetical protein